MFPRFLPRLAREKRKSRCAEIRSEEEEDSCRTKKGGVKGVRWPGRFTASTVDQEKAVAAISGFSDGKLKTEYELPLCAPAQGESRRGHGGDRVKILSYFRMTGLGLVSRLALVDIWSYRGMLRKRSLWYRVCSPLDTDKLHNGT